MCKESKYIKLNLKENKNDRYGWLQNINHLYQSSVPNLSENFDRFVLFRILARILLYFDYDSWWFLRTLQVFTFGVQIQVVRFMNTFNFRGKNSFYNTANILTVSDNDTWIKVVFSITILFTVQWSYVCQGRR